jgi:oxygen-independent coproporphyrinogen-3 oxidase
MMMMSTQRQSAFLQLFNQHVVVPPALLQRYNLSGPRYTSYPTVPVWQEANTEGFEAEPQLRHRLQAAFTLPVPLALYIHLPFCAQRCLFCGCNVVITQQTSHAETYLGYLFKEIELVAALHGGTPQPVTQLHLGGGTPTYLSPQQLQRLVQKLKQHFTLEHQAELSVEVDPRVTTREHLEALAAEGFNRISLGLQDFNPATQQAIARIQSVQQTTQQVQWARELGFAGVNIDLIYGLPHQTLETFAHTVQQTLALRPDRLALYNYAHVPWMAPWQRQLEEGDNTLPSGELKYQLFCQSVQALLQAGYVYIGMDHFALPEDELSHAWEEGTLHRNFMGYTTRSGQAQLVGLGLSAISGWQGHYSQNIKKLKPYYAALDAGELPVWRGLVLSDDDQQRRWVVQRIMCQQRVVFAEWALAFEALPAFEKAFAPELQALEPLVADGLLVWEQAAEGQPATGFVLTPLGRIFSRNVAMVFDAHLAKEPPTTEATQFSKTL